MMTISSITGTNNSNMPAGCSSMNMQTDSVSKNIQNQIADAQERLQKISSNEEMSLEEKMKKRQEIQQEITALNQQLRQYQIEQRKEQQPKGKSANDMFGGSRKAGTAKAGSKGTGLAYAMISADLSMKQAKVQGNIAAQMEGKAGVLESEIEMDKGRGADTEKKEEELADLQARVQTTTEAQISTLSDASKVMEEAAKADQTEEITENRNDKADKTEQAAESEEKSGGTAKNVTSNITRVR